MKTSLIIGRYYDYGDLDISRQSSKDSIHVVSDNEDRRKACFTSNYYTGSKSTLEWCLLPKNYHNLNDAQFHIDGTSRYFMPMTVCIVLPYEMIVFKGDKRSYQEATVEVRALYKP